jgi:hypothetical protein
MTWSLRKTAEVFTAIFLFVSIAATLAHGDENETSSLLKIYDASNPNTRVQIERLLIGAQRGMRVANSWMEQGRKQTPLYCQPKNLSLTGLELVSMLREITKDGPEFQQADWGYSLLLALMKTFPCAKNSN